MKAEKSMAELADSLQESTHKSAKWIQNVNQELLRSQNEQLKFGNKLFRKAAESIQLNGKRKNTNLSQNSSGELLMETMQKGMENFFNSIKLTADKSLEMNEGFAPQKYSDNFMSALDSFTNQLEMMALNNQNNYELLTQQLETTKDSVMPLVEEFRRELNASYDLSKENLQRIMDSYMEVGTTAVEANQGQLDKAISLMNENFSKTLSSLENIYSQNTGLTRNEKEKKKDHPTQKSKTSNHKTSKPVDHMA